jgi:hypothetical protein
VQEKVRLGTVDCSNLVLAVFEAALGEGKVVAEGARGADVVHATSKLGGEGAADVVGTPVGHVYELHAPFECARRCH